MKARSSGFNFAASIILMASVASAASGSSPAVAMVCTGTRWDAYGDFLSEFSLTNASGDVISYSGYGPYGPIYTTQVRSRGQWTDPAVRGGLCGVGLGTQRLARNQSITFTVPPPNGDQAWRIGVELTSSSPDKAVKRTEIVWSPPVTTQARSKIERAGSVATSLVKTEVFWNSGDKFPYTFRLSNKSAKTLYYGGYREADVPPIYLIQYRDGGHWLGDGLADWSGSNLGFKQLRPGDSIMFSIPAQSLDSTWRIGIRFYRTDAPRAPEDMYRPVWSPELPAR